MTLSELLGMPVRTEAGEKLGHVHDVRAEASNGDLHVTAVVVGLPGLLERLGLRPVRARERGAVDVVEWRRVRSVGARELVVAPKQP